MGGSLCECIAHTLVLSLSEQNLTIGPHKLTSHVSSSLPVTRSLYEAIYPPTLYRPDSRWVGAKADFS